MRDCLIGIFGPALYAELNTRPPSPSEGAAFGPCMAPGGADSGQTNPGSLPAAGPAFNCPSETQPVSSTAWETENDSLFDYLALGHSSPSGLAEGEDPSIGSADARLVSLPDGSYRLYFAVMGEGIYTATSQDGLGWQLEARSVLPRYMPHTSLVPLEEGGWRLFTVTVASGELTVVKSFSTVNGVEFTEDPGFRITANEFPFGDIQSPYVVQLHDGTYRMYLMTVPKGEMVGQSGGNSAIWMVSATSADMLTWTADPVVLVEDMEHPRAVAESDGSVTVYAGEPLTKRTSPDGRNFSDPEYLDLRGIDFDMMFLPDGQMRVYSGGHSDSEGSWLRISRSVTVPWDLEFTVTGFVGSDVFTVEVCVLGSSPTPIEIHLTQGDRRIRDLDLEATAISVRESYPPFHTTVGLKRDWPSGSRNVGPDHMKILRVTDGTAVREWSFLEEFVWTD